MLLMMPSVTSSDADGALRLRPEGAGIHIHHLHADELRTEKAHDVEDRHQQRHGDDAAQETGRGHVAHRVDGHHLHRGELVGRAHQADFGGQRGAGAAGEQQRRDHRAELLQQPSAAATPSTSSRPEARQQIDAGEREHHADEQARQHDDDQRARARVADLVAPPVSAARAPGQALREQAHEEQGDLPHFAEAADDEVVAVATRAHSSPPAVPADSPARDSGTARDHRRCPSHELLHDFEAARGELLRRARRTTLPPDMR